MLRSVLVSAVVLAYCGTGALGQQCTYRVIDFESLQHDDMQVALHGRHYEEGDFAIDHIGPDIAGFELGTFGMQDNRFSGSTALFHVGGGEFASLAAVDGQPFTLVSVDLAQIVNTLGGPQEFVGFLEDSTTVNQTFVLDAGYYHKQRFFFSGFEDVVEVRWGNVNAPQVQVDNFRVEFMQAVVPAISDLGFGIMLLFIVAVAGFVFKRGKLQEVESCEN